MFFLAAPKMLGFNCGQSLEIGPSIVGRMGHFTTQFATSECRQYPKASVARVDLS